MINATDLKNGTTFLYEGKPYSVIKYEHIKMGRGGAIVKLSVRNILTGGVEPKTFSTEVKLDEVNTTKRKLSFLYKDGKTAVFMDPKTYEQVEIPVSVITDQLVYVKEGEETVVLFWDDQPLSLELPPNTVIKVASTDPGVKGNSATNIYKPAVLENGLNIKVPLFINSGESIRVDTRTGEYLERAKK